MSTPDNCQKLAALVQSLANEDSIKKALAECFIVEAAFQSEYWDCDAIDKLLKDTDFAPLLKQGMPRG